MKKTLLVIVALAGAVLGAQSTTVLTPAQTLDRRGIGELELSPDGARLVFTVTEPVKGAARQRNLWLLEIASAQVRQLTFSTKSDSSPRWAPDGRAIAFLSDRDGAAQLYLLPMGGGEAQKITDRKERVEAFRWSPDGSHIALLMPEPKPDAQQQREKDKDDARVAEKEDRRARIWTIELGSHALKQITTAPFRIGQIEFAPGRRPADRRRVRETRMRRSVQRSHLLRRSQRRALHAAGRAARTDGHDGDLARRQGHPRLCLRARRRPRGARSLPAAGCSGGAARNLTGARDRSADQPAEVDRQPDARRERRPASNLRWWRSSTRRHRPSNRRRVGQRLRVCSHDGRHHRLCQRDASAAPELWIKTANAPASGRSNT